MLSFARSTPYVYLIARTAFHEMPRSAIEAARLASHGSLGRLLAAAVPLARPAIAAGATLALMETLADFGTVSYFAVGLHHRHLQSVVLDGRRGRGGAARRPLGTGQSCWRWSVPAAGARRITASRRASPCRRTA